MHFATVVLFVSSVILACITSSTGDPGPNVTVANLSGSLRFSTKDINQIFAIQLLGANATTNQDERMLSPFTSLLEKMQRFISNFVCHLRAYKWITIDKSAEKVLNRFHPKTTVKGDTFKLAQDFWDGLTQSDLKALLLFFKMKNKRSRGAKVAFVEALTTKYGATEMVEVLLKARDPDFDDKFRAEVATLLLDDLSWSWRKSGERVDDVFWRIHRPVGDELSRPQQKLFQEFISPGHKSQAMPSFKAEANDLADVEGILSLLTGAEKMSGKPGRIARDVENAILIKWAKDGKTLLDLLAVLKVPFIHIYDTLFWNLLFKFSRLVVECGQKPIGVWDALRKFYGDGQFVNALLEARVQKPIPAKAYWFREDWLFEQWASEVHADVAKLTQNLRDTKDVSEETVARIVREYANWYKTNTA